MNDKQKQILLKTARDSVEAVIKETASPKPQSDDQQLNAPLGCFVTLKNKDKLRGCIGQFTSDKPLIKLISEMARSSGVYLCRLRLFPGVWQ